MTNKSVYLAKQIRQMIMKKLNLDIDEMFNYIQINHEKVEKNMNVMTDWDLISLFEDIKREKNRKTIINGSINELVITSMIVNLNE